MLSNCAKLHKKCESHCTCLAAPQATPLAHVVTHTFTGTMAGLRSCKAFPKSSWYPALLQYDGDVAVVTVFVSLQDRVNGQGCTGSGRFLPHLLHEPKGWSQRVGERGVL